MGGGEGGGGGAHTANEDPFENPFHFIRFCCLGAEGKQGLLWNPCIPTGASCVAGPIVPVPVCHSCVLPTAHRRPEASSVNAPRPGRRSPPLGCSPAACDACACAWTETGWSPGRGLLRRLALRSVSPRALPAASRRSRGVLRRYAAVSIAEVGHSAALRLPAARACVCAWTENGRPRGLLRGLALRGRDHGQRPRCRAHCFLDIWRADTPVISRRARVCVAVRATPRSAQHYKRASARADAARDHGKESRPRTCRDGCAAHRVQTSEQTPRLWRPNLRDEETRRVERTPHRCRIDGATHRPGAIQDLAVSARCRSSLPRRPGCPPPVGIEAQDRRPTNHSIDRCSVLPAEQGGNLDRT